MGFRRTLYRIYERQLTASLDRSRIPAHVGVILDGNRRWARAAGEQPVTGHRAGAGKIEELLTWCEDLGISHATLWMLSTDNFSRDSQELEDLLQVIETTISDLAGRKRWRIHPVGALDLLPPDMVRRIKEASEGCAASSGLHVNVAIGYGGRREISDAVRALLEEEAAKGRSLEEALANFDADAISRHLYTAGQPDPDLVIRTSGEQRLGGFLLWQSVHSEYYFCEAYWPDFRKIDFLRALRSYAARNRRFGT